MGRLARWEDDDSERRNEPLAIVGTLLTGDDAYARRLAMSQDVPMQPSPPPTSAALPAAETGEEAYQRRLVLSQGRMPAASTAPVHEVQPSPPPPPPAAVDVPDQTPATPASERQAFDFEARLKHSREAAAAVAAKLAKLASTAPPPEAAQTTVETNNEYVMSLHLCSLF